MGELIPGGSLLHGAIVQVEAASRRKLRGRVALNLPAGRPLLFTLSEPIVVAIRKV